MKRVAITLLMGLSLAAPVAGADRVEERDAWTREFPVQTTAPTLRLRNVWGDITVRPGPSGVISVSLQSLRSAPTVDRLERSRTVLPLVVDATTEGVDLHVGDRSGHWYRRDPCRGCRFEAQFEVRVPPGTQVDVSTVNDGAVDVEGITGEVSAGNVNGPVSVSGAHACAELNSINGPVRIRFAAIPSADCAIETLNGDIRLEMPPGSGFDVAMQLTHGRLVSAFPVDALALPARVSHERVDGRQQYRIEQPAGIRVANGGPVFTLSSMNGDVRIEETH